MAAQCYYRFLIIWVMAATIPTSWSQQQCRYEFIVPEGNGVSCGTPDVGRIDSELSIARERANSVAATLGSEITKMQNASAAVQEEMKAISQDLGQIKTELGKIDTENQNFADMEEALHRMNETVYSDYKFLSRKVMDTSVSLQMQLTRQMDIVAALASEQSSQRQLLNKQTITLSDLQRLPQSVQGVQNEVNSLKTTVEKNGQGMTNFERELQAVRESVQRSEEKVEEQISIVNSKIDGLQSTLLGVDLKTIQRDVVSLVQKTKLLGNTLETHSKLLEGFDPGRLHNTLSAFEEDLNAQRETVNNLRNKTLSSSPALISQKLSELSDTVNRDREATKDMWNGLWERLNSATKIIEALSRDVAKIKTSDQNNENPGNA